MGDGFVEYRAADDNTHRIECNDVVALGGMKPAQTEAMTLVDYGGDFYMIGDCRHVGNIHTGSWDAYSVTHQF